MLSKARIKLIKSLQIKKYRKQEQLFVVQGAKGVTELLGSAFEVVTIAGTREYLQSSANTIAHGIEILETTEQELQSIGEFQTNESVLAVARMRPNDPLVIHPDEFVLVLDDIRDPGNLGTIIRTADWYGIPKIIASEETADFYNPKVISATMGSFTRVHIQYTDLGSLLGNISMEVYGAFLGGQNVHRTSFDHGGLVVIGNESRGISDEVARYVTQKITIPAFGHAESLNAAIATAVICDNIRRGG